MKMSAENEGSKKVVDDSSQEGSNESFEEFAEDELYENVFDNVEDDAASVSDVEVSSSDEDIMMIKQKIERKRVKQAASDSDEEEKEPRKDVSSLVKTNPDFIKMNDAKGNNEIEVFFELVHPSEAYYHQIKALLMKYLDGQEAEDLDIISLTEHICERISIGQVVATPLEAG